MSNTEHAFDFEPDVATQFVTPTFGGSRVLNYRHAFPLSANARQRHAVLTKDAQKN